MIATDSISISDRMSNSSSLFIPPHPPLKATTISTIAVQCFESRMVIALLQSGDTLNLRILEMTPTLTALGKNIEENERYLNEHKNVLEKLRNNQTPVEEYFRKTNDLASNQNPELYAAMGDTLGQAWRDLIANLELRKEILNLGIIFHRYRNECLDNLEVPDYTSARKDYVLQKFSNASEAGRKLLEKLETVEDSWESVAMVKDWLQELQTKHEEWKTTESMIERSTLNAIFDELKTELDDIIASRNFESKMERLMGLLARVKANASSLTQEKKLWFESTIYLLMDELTARSKTIAGVRDFVDDMRQLDAPRFKERYSENLRTVRNLNEELVRIIHKRLTIREEYEEIIQNVLGYSEEEIIYKLSQDKNLEINGALENIRFERNKQETELFELFKEEVQNLEAASGRSGDLERIIFDTTNLRVQIENAPEFHNKSELIERCTQLREELVDKTQTLENISSFVSNYRELVEESFSTEHSAVFQDLERLNQQNSSLAKIIKNRMSVRRSFEDILKNPTQFEEDEIVELLTREDSLDATTAFKVIKEEKKLQELLQTLDFPLPENLEIARNDLNDFKAFEKIIESLPNGTEELIEKTIQKKKKILKCIDFYEMVESTERTKHVKQISRLEIELFGTTHISESIYEEKISHIEKLRQMEAAESQKARKPESSNIEVQTDDELMPLQERARTPPPLLIETNTQTKEIESLDVRNSETQTIKMPSSYSATQTIPEQSKPIIAANTETQTIEIPPQIIYLTQESIPVKLRNNQTQTIDEGFETVQKRSEMLIEQTFEEFESRQADQQKSETSAMSTQTQFTPTKSNEVLNNGDTLLMKTSDVQSVAKLLLNSECQTENETILLSKTAERVALRPNQERKPLVFVDPSDGDAKLPNPVVPLDEERRPQFINALHDTYQSTDCQTITKISSEEAEIQLLPRQMSVRDRVRYWQITSPPEEGTTKTWKIPEKKSDTSDSKNYRDSTAPPDNPIANYRLLFQSPIEGPNLESVESQHVLQETDANDGEHTRKRSVAEYRQMFQSFQSSQNESYEYFHKPQTKYWKPKVANDEKFVPTKSEQSDSFRVTDSARERTLAMYKKLMQYDNGEGQKIQNVKSEKQADAFRPISKYSEQADLGYKSAGFGLSEESIDGLYCSSSSERSHVPNRIGPMIQKYNTLPIRPSKFVRKEFQESDYESDYDCKIPSMWVPPGGRPPNSLRGGSPYRSIPSDYRSRSVPPADMKSSERLPWNSNSAVHTRSLSLRSNQVSTFNSRNHPQQENDYYVKPTYQELQISPIKPIPPPKPSSRITSPDVQLSGETSTITSEMSLRSEVTKREETKITMGPNETVQGQDDDLILARRPEFYVSVTSPPIIIPKGEVVTKRLYESHEERMEQTTETNFGGPEYSQLVKSKSFDDQFGPTQHIRRPLPTITTFHSQKELMHPILYELDDKNAMNDSKESDFEYYDSDKTLLQQESHKSIGRTKHMEVKRFTPSIFIPLVTSEEEFSSAEEEFIVEPKWKPLACKPEAETRFAPVKAPGQKTQKEIQNDPGVFYMACDFSCEYGILGTGSKK